MSELSTVQGSVTLRKLRTGVTATISLSSTMQLFQLYDDATTPITYAPDWSGTNTHPRVTVSAVSSQGALTIVGVTWKINGVDASGGAIPGCSTGADASGNKYLDINTNLAQQSILNFNSGTLSADITFSDASGITQTVTKTEIIRVQKAVSQGYNVMINANKTYVDESTSASNPTTLTAVCYFGTTLVSSGITFKWLKSTTDAPTAQTPTGATYNITSPDDVNGTQLYLCRAYDGSNVEVDAEGIMIVDNSDPCYITASVVQTKSGSDQPRQNNVTSVNVGSDCESSVVTFKVQNSDGSAYGNVSSWTAEKKHADTMKLIGSVSGAGYTKDTDAVDSYNTKTASNASSVSISVFDADYSSVGAGSAEKHDTEVVVTATANL